MFPSNVGHLCIEKGDITLKNPEQMTGAQFFPNGKINYAENLLRHRSDDQAIIFQSEIVYKK